MKNFLIKKFPIFEIFFSNNNKGFTLIEMMVAVALFTVVMTVSVGALLSVVDANKKAQALQSVMNNLNVSIDGMVRNIRMGSQYHCGIGSLSSPRNCINSGDLIAFEPFGGDPSDSSNQWVYWIQNNRLYKSEDSRTTEIPITSPEVKIDSFNVYVTGASRTLNNNGDTNQPKVVLMIKGTVGAESNTGSLIGSKKKTRTTFNIQTVASQRVLDL